jgi:hypothetical protein
MVARGRGLEDAERGSVEVLSAIGDERDALITIKMRIGLGPGGTMVTMASACLYGVDEKIKKERHQFFVLSE